MFSWSLTRNACAVVLAFILGLPVRGLADSGSKSLKLEEAVSEALSNNRDLVAARYAIHQAEGRLRQAGLWPNPELELTRNFDQPFHNEGEFTGAAGFSQKFPISGRLAKAEKLARVDVALAALEVRNEERLLIGEVVSQYRELLVLGEKLRTVDQIQRTLNELLAVSERRLKVAEVSPTDVNLEKLELEKIQFARSSLVIEEEKARVELNRLLGREPGEALRATGDTVVPLVPDNLHHAIEGASARRPDRQLAALQIDRAAAEIKLARAERWEDWTIGLEYEREKSVFDTPVIDSQTDDFAGIRLSVPLPLWNQNQGRIAEAEASRSRAHESLRAFDLKVQAEVQSAEIQVRRLYDILEQYKKEALALSEQNVSLLQKSYADGLVPITAVLQAQQQLRELRQSYVDAVGDYLKALTEFETFTASSPFLTHDRR